MLRVKNGERFAIFALALTGLAACLAGAAKPAEAEPEPLPVVSAAERTAAPTPKATPTHRIILDPAEIEYIGRTIWGEAGGIPDPAERAAVAWCILNRVDARGQSIQTVVTADHQFLGYRRRGECPQEHLDLAADVLTRWKREKAGETNVGRTLPAGYQYFYGDGQHNYFTKEWRRGSRWDWSLPSPYTTEGASK